MNYYRRHIGDYMTATAGLSLREHGAYALLLDYYYANEKPLALDPKSIFRIAQCGSAEDRRATLRVLERFFIKTDDGWRQKRADEEIGIASKAIEKQRVSGKEAALKRWHGDMGQPNGSTHRSTHNENDRSTHGLGYGSEHGSAMQPPTLNHQPTPKPKPQIISATSTGKTADATPSEPDPRTVATVEQLRVTAGVGTDDHAKAGALFAVLKANSCTGTPSDPRVLEWVRNGLTPDGLRSVIAKARESSQDVLGPNYLNRVMDSMRTAKGNGKGAAWATDESACDAKARELGLTARPGESYQQLRNRISAALTRSASESVR